MNSRIAQVRFWFERIYLGGIPQLIKDETAFLAFVCMLAGIEALGGYLDPDSSSPVANATRFQDFIRTYFPERYRPHAAALWDFRNGMVHGFSRRQFVLTHHNSHAHFAEGDGRAIILNAEDFYSAFLTASEAYFSDLAGSEELQAKFARRLESPKGGGIGVGFVELSKEEPA